MNSPNTKEQFSAYCQTVERENKLKALLVSLSAGFAVAFFVATLMWFSRMNALLLSLIIVAIFALAGPPLLLRTLYRTEESSSAKRLDRMGLEERMVTMVERKERDDLFSRLQREDARQQLSGIEENRLKLRIPRWIVILVCVCAFLSCSMTTVSVLTATGRLMSGAELLGPLLPDTPIQYVHIEYIVEGGGYIDGEEFQEIVLGESGTEVRAIADEGWIFLCWDDNLEAPDREDADVQTDVIFTAIFVVVEDDLYEISIPGAPGEEGEPDSDPGEPSNGVSQDQEGKGEESAPSDGGNHLGAGGKYDSANQIIDGETYYREVYGQYWDEIQVMLSSGQEVPEDIRDLIQLYFGTIN